MLCPSQTWFSSNKAVLRPWSYWQIRISQSDCRSFVRQKVKQSKKDLYRQFAGDTVPSVELDDQSDENSQSSQFSRQPYQLLGLLAMVGAGIVFFYTGDRGVKVYEMLKNSILGQSGFLASFSLIFLAEIGDKTFFIAALLAMKLGRWISLVGSTSSLAVMTVISVAIGQMFKSVPQALYSSLPIGEWLGTIFLVVFGIRALLEGLSQNTEDDESDAELKEAQRSLSQAESQGKVQGGYLYQQFFQVFTIIFLAEWGDRSMLATIALAAKSNPYGVATGASFGHLVATAIAVVGGGIVAKYISEKTVSLISGILFLVFALASFFT
eukprot:TRINITY_DN8413_c0_g1_i1.p1 TRINITY_DN8413_c0_g1~~TRINITY_DN8413_c0_g1_i1.p1  ORF type:complete len:344 (-),score=27.99 TRINITY_DN8413_c0_g1_i1:526-1500(-)